MDVSDLRNPARRSDRPRAAEEAAALGELRDALPALEERLRDPAKERRRQSAEEELAAAERLKAHARRRRSEVDGTDERARAGRRARMRSAL